MYPVQVNKPQQTDGDNCKTRSGADPIMTSHCGNLNITETKHLDAESYISG